MFSYFARKQVLTFHANCLHWRRFVWNVKSCFLEKKNHQFEFCWTSPESGKILYWRRRYYQKKSPKTIYMRLPRTDTDHNHRARPSNGPNLVSLIWNIIEQQHTKEYRMNKSKWNSNRHTVLELSTVKLLWEIPLIVVFLVRDSPNCGSSSNADILMRDSSNAILLMRNSSDAALIMRDSSNAVLLMRDSSNAVLLMRESSNAVLLMRVSSNAVCATVVS